MTLFHILTTQFVSNQIKVSTQGRGRDTAGKVKRNSFPFILLIFQSIYLHGAFFKAMRTVCFSAIKVIIGGIRGAGSGAWELTAVEGPLTWCQELYGS